VAELPQDAAQLKRLHKAAKQLGDRFSMEKMCASYAELLSATIKSGRRHSFGFIKNRHNLEKN